MPVPKGEYLQYGGQAIVEGVMMRSPHYFAVAVRAPNGEIVLQKEHLAKTWIGRQKWLKLPFLRGSLAILDAMTLGSRAMRFASNVQLDPAMQPDAEADPKLESTGERSVEGSKIVQPSAAGGGSLNSIAVGGALVVGVALGLLIFKLLPLILSEQFKRFGVTNQIALNGVQGFLGIAFFIGYLYGISKFPDIHRIFKYHGAEHKAINTLELDDELNLENCKAQTRLHPRCGTSFAIVVLIIDLLFGVIFLPREYVHTWPVAANLGLRMVINLFLLFPFAGIAYELIRLAGKFRNSSFVTALFAPGLALQLITTAEPDPDQIEVALTALRACVTAEEGDKDPADQIKEPLESIA
ncbi:MAG TPA: DUF1385 domain-containing protein [Fimbriimonadaceae bacterium]